jgi:hypothetical protein
MRKNRAKEAFDAAKQLAADGKFQEALERHIWFHDNALTIDESYYEHERYGSDGTLIMCHG